MGGADRRDLALLQDAQQFRLQLQRHFADLVEKRDAPFRGAKHAQGGAQGPGERTAFVAEQLAFGKRCRECRAVDRHEGLHCPRTADVQHAGPDFLSRARLARDQDRAFHFGGAHGVLRNATDCWVAAEHPIELRRLAQQKARRRKPRYPSERRPQAHFSSKRRSLEARRPIHQRGFSLRKSARRGVVTRSTCGLQRTIPVSITITHPALGAADGNRSHFMRIERGRRLAGCSKRPMPGV